MFILIHPNCVLIIGCLSVETFTQSLRNSSNIVALCYNSFILIVYFYDFWVAECVNCVIVIIIFMFILVLPQLSPMSGKIINVWKNHNFAYIYYLNIYKYWDIKYYNKNITSCNGIQISWKISTTISKSSVFIFVQAIRLHYNISHWRPRL